MKIRKAGDRFVSICISGRGGPKRLYRIPLDRLDGQAEQVNRGLCGKQMNERLANYSPINSARSEFLNILSE